MMQIIKSNERHTGNFGWLTARWHFSFGDYRDPKNVNWGTLRVFNDDVIEGGGGFEPHPHKDMEIVTLVLSGRLEHQDSLGNRGVVHPDEVQVMSAGTGITHAEFNASATEPLRLLQLWIFPRNRGNAPRWEQRQYGPADFEDRLATLVSGGSVPGALAIDQDATVNRGKLSAGTSVTHATATDRKVYVFVVDGSVRVNGQALDAGDQGRIADEASVRIEAVTAADVVVLDLPEV